MAGPGEYRSEDRSEGKRECREHGYDATAEQVRQELASAGYLEYVDGLPGHVAAFLLAEGAGVMVSLHLEAPPATVTERRAVFAGYASALIRGGSRWITGAVTCMSTAGRRLLAA